MKKSINEILIDKIQENISPNEKMVIYLMDKLSLGRESAYRRIRNQIPFTIEEIVKLADEFGFSVDDIIGRSTNQHILVDVKNGTFQNPQQAFIEMLDMHYNIMMNVYQAEKKEMISALNRLGPSYVAGQEYLFKFYYYKWMHQLYQAPSTLKYSDITVPQEIITAKNKLISLLRQTTNTTCTYILDQNIYLNIVREIQYYYKRGLISDEELYLIKKDFHDIIYIVEDMVQNSVNNLNNRYLYYISMSALEASCVYIYHDDNMLISTTPCSFFPMYMTNRETCMMLKKWMDSLKKFSALITESNEYMQAAFFKKQHEYIDMDFKDSIFTFMNDT